MYSFEIEDYLRQRNYKLKPEECSYIMDIQRSSQICNIKYYPADNDYVIETTDGYKFSFEIKKD